MCPAKHGTPLVSRRETTASRYFSTAGSFSSRPTEEFRPLPARLVCGPTPAAWPCSKASKSRRSISWKIKQPREDQHALPTCTALLSPLDVERNLGASHRKPLRKQLRRGPQPLERHLRGNRTPRSQC